ncbi:helix-turn-helix domain-containing protein [Streptomyces sp. NRRL F-2580]|uniref:helix-turn-helix domain-containing protein n=1 Tax=Streptomyces sp. NRRL F-2580 TaxID=1463841 RepID=UPI0004CB5D13|nr:GAF domain-containing protein [Streptomyces sp. NRRL F-2580]
MLPAVTPPGTQHAHTAVRRLLDLLAEGAPAEDYARPAAEARDAGAPAGELADIAEATDVALRIRRTLGQHRRREAELTALFDTASDLAALRDLDAVLRAIVHRAKLLLGTDVTYLSLNDEAAGDTYMRVTDGSVAAAFQQVRLGMGEGLGGLVAQTARPYATGDYQADSRFHHTSAIDGAVGQEGLRAILGVPLRVGARIIGVLYAADRAPRQFSPEEVALLSSLADHAAIAIDGARLLEETRAALADLNSASETIRAHSEDVRRAERAHDQLTDLVLRGGGADEVAAAIAAILDGALVIHDAHGAELARAGAGPVPPPARAVEASRASGRAVPQDGTWVCAVLAGPELLGSLALTGRTALSDTDRLLFERASVVTALLLLLRRSVAETEDRVRGELLTDLLALTTDPGALAARARRLGVDLSRPHCVFVMHGDVASRHRLLAAAARSGPARGALAGIHHDHVVLVAPVGAPGPTAKALAAELGQAVGSPVTVGAAGPTTGPAGLSAAHDEAHRCLSALRALGHSGRGGALSELGFVGVLLGDQADLVGYVRNTLGPLLDYDDRRGTDLVHTLDAYFAQGTSLTRTRAALHVHVNTVVQRLDRIGRLLGEDWNSPARTLEIQLALRLHRLTHGL